MSEQRLQAMRELAEAWNSGEVDAYLDQLDPEFEFTPDPSFPDSDTFQGERLRAWLHGWADTWKRNHLEVIEITDRGSAVLARCRWHLLMQEGSSEVPTSDFSFVLFLNERDRPRRLLAFFDHDRAVEAVQRD